MTYHRIIFFVFVDFNEVVWGGTLRWKPGNRRQHDLRCLLNWKAVQLTSGYPALCFTLKAGWRANFKNLGLYCLFKLPRMDGGIPRINLLKFCGLFPHVRVSQWRFLYGKECARHSTLCFPWDDHLSDSLSRSKYTHSVVMKMADGHGYSPSLPVSQLTKGVSNAESLIMSLKPINPFPWLTL